MVAFSSLNRPKISVPGVRYSSAHRIFSKNEPLFRGNEDGNYQDLYKKDSPLDYGTQPYSGSKIREADGYLSYVLDANLKPGDEILELGCNFGNNALPLASKYRVYGVDLEKALVDNLARNASLSRLDKNLTVAQWDFAENGDTPWPEMKGRFKAIYAVHVLSHLSDDRFVQTMQKLQEQLAHGGLIVITNLQPQNKAAVLKEYQRIQHLFKKLSHINYLFRNMPFETWCLKSGYVPHDEDTMRRAFSGMREVSKFTRPYTKTEVVGWDLPREWIHWRVFQKPLETNSQTP